MQPALAPPRRGPWIVLALAVTLALVFAAIAVPLLRRQQRAKGSNFLGPVPAFTLLDQAGHVVEPSAWRGHVTILNFIFTRCTTICPVLTTRMAAVERRTAAFGDTIRFASISVDPAYDTPTTLMAYANEYQVNLSRWSLLTTATPGESHQRLIEHGFLTALDPATAESIDIVHGGHFLISDGNGGLRGPYDSDDPARLDDLVKDARALVLALPPQPAAAAPAR